MSEEFRLSAIREKVEAGVRLSFDDGMVLEEHADLFALRELANKVRERKNGRCRPGHSGRSLFRGSPLDSATADREHDNIWQSS